MLLILAGVTIAALTGSDSAPAKANEASQKNDIGAAKDDVQLTAVNALQEAYETVYVADGVSAGNAKTTVGKNVIKALYDKYGDGTQLGNATISILVTGNTSDLQEITGGSISIYTTDFELVGDVVLEGGTIDWEEIVANIPATVDRVELSPTSLEIEQGGSATVEVKCYNSSNNLIPTRKLGEISIERKSGSTNITVNKDATNRNKATIMVDESETVGTRKAVITATVGGVEAVADKRCTIDVKKKVPLIGQYVEYNVSYTDMYVADIDTTTDGNQGFTSTNGWRILDPGTLNEDGSYSGTKIISTGVPALLYYHCISNIDSSNTWWDIRDTSQGSGIKAARGLENARIAIDTEGVYRGFEAIIFEHKSSRLTANKGGYTSINGTTSGDLTGAVFKTSQAESVATLTERDLNVALTTLNESTTQGSNLFYLKGLNSGTDNYNYGSASPMYWLASANVDNTYYLRGVYYSRFNQ